MGSPVVILDKSSVKFEIEQEQAGALLFRIRGILDEEATFGEALKLLTEMAPRKIVFDLQPLIRINSCGVREWLLFIEKLRVPEGFTFTKVSEPFLEQANIVPALLGKPVSSIELIEAPYYCGDCDLRVGKQLKVSELGDLANGSEEPPQFKCEKCSSPLEFDALPEEYFSFLNFLKKP